MEKEITIEIKHLEIIALLAFLLITLSLELWVNLNSHIVFGDEGFHARISQVIAQKVEYPKWTPIGETDLEKSGYARPPLLNLLGASLFYIFGFNDVLLKILNPFIGTILTGVAAFVLVKRIYDSKVALIASVICVTIPSLVTYSVLYYTEVLSMFYFFTSVLTLVVAIKTEGKKYWILSGLLGGLSFLTKAPAFALFPFVIVVFLYQFYKQGGFLKTFKKYVLWSLFFGLLIVPFFIRGYILYGNPSCNLAVFPFFSTDGCAYSKTPAPQYQFEGVAEQAGTEQNVFRMGLMSYFDFAYGNVWFALLGFLGGLVILLWRKKTEDVTILFALLTLFLIIIRNYDTRAENLSRWLLPWTPLIALIAGDYFASAYDFVKSNWTLFGILLLVLINVLILWNYFPFSLTEKAIIGIIIIISEFYFAITKKYKPALAIAFIFILLVSFTNFYNKLETMKGVKQFSPLFFQACDWVKQNTPMNIRIANTIWGSATAYNCQRDIGGGGPDVTLSQNMTLMLPELKLAKATHLFVQKFSISWTDQKLSEKYPISYVRFLESHPEHFKKIYENGPSLDECYNAGGCDGTILYEIIY